MLSSSHLAGSRRFAILPLLLAVLAWTSIPAKAEDFPAEKMASVDQAIGTVMAENHIPGAVLVVVSRGQVAYSRGYGLAEIATNQPVDPARSLFRLASVSKLFTWASLLRLTQEGRVDLDRDISVWLGGFPLRRRFDDPLTVRHLLTHTGGFEDEGFGTIFVRGPKDVQPLEPFLADHMATQVRRPGGVPAYSNTGASLGALVVQKVAGMPFVKYVETTFLRPSGMNIASYAEPYPADVAPHAAKGYRWTGSGYVEGPFEYVGNWQAAGGLSATGEEMGRFIAVLMGYRPDILSPETVALMQAPARRPHPAAPGMALGLMEGEFAGHRTLYHDGDIEMFHTQLLLVPDQDIGYFLAFSSFGGVFARPVMQQTILKALLPVTLERATTVPPEPPRQDLSFYAGAFVSLRQNVTTLAKGFRVLQAPVTIRPDADGKGLLTIEGDEPRHWRPIARDLFEDANNGQRLAFVEEERVGLVAVRGEDPVTPLYRQPPLEAPTVSWAITWTSLALCVAALAAGLRGARRNRGFVRWSGLFLAAFSLLMILFASSLWFVLESAGLVELYTAIPFSLRLVLVLPILAIATAVAYGATLPAVWQHSTGRPFLRVASVLAIFWMGGVIAFLDVWNLVGWRF